MPYLNLHLPHSRKPCVTALWDYEIKTVTIVTEHIPDLIRFIISDKIPFTNKNGEPEYQITISEYYCIIAVHRTGIPLEKALNIYGLEYKWIAFQLFTLESHERTRSHNRTPMHRHHIRSPIPYKGNSLLPWVNKTNIPC